jgi:hypothetical protein
MNEALQHAEQSYKDDDINTLAQRHFDNIQVQWTRINYSLIKDIICSI